MKSHQALVFHPCGIALTVFESNHLHIDIKQAPTAPYINMVVRFEYITLLAAFLAVLPTTLAIPPAHEDYPQRLQQRVTAATATATSTTTANMERTTPDHEPPVSPCDRFDNLPEECVCSELPRHHLEIECLKPFQSPLFNDTVGILMDLDICNAAGSQLDLELIELDYNITYTLAGLHAGEDSNYPIPGWSIIIPGLGHVGMDVAVSIAGNPDMLMIKIGLNACLAFAGHIVCAESIPGLNLILPWYILSGSYSFGDWCETTTTTTAVSSS
jgi:hypothetical protein